MLWRRIILIALCLMLPAVSLAAETEEQSLVVHADFSLNLKVHSGAFPDTDAHIQDWETFLDKLTLAGSLDEWGILEPESRLYADAAIYLNGEEAIPFVFDNYNANHYLITPALRDDPVLFYMNSYFEFMLKPYYYLRLPTNYIAVLTYPAAIVYLVELYYTPLRAVLDAAKEAALQNADEETDTVSYTVSFEELLALCDSFNAVVTNDERFSRLRWFVNSLLAEFYVYDAVVEAMSHFELILAALDPGMEGMTVTETADGITCTIGGQEIFTKTVSASQTDTAFTLSLPGDMQIALTWSSEATDDAMALSAAVHVTEADEEVLWVTADGEGLPAEGALTGEGFMTLATGGREYYGAEPEPQTLTFSWSRTALELPYDLDLSIGWLHPATGLEAFTVYFTGAFSQSDLSVFTDNAYPQIHFFGLNPTLLEEFKSNWGPSILAYLTPVALEMPRGVIDDIVDYLLDSDILISLLE